MRAYSTQVRLYENRAPGDFVCSLLDVRNTWQSPLSVFGLYAEISHGQHKLVGFLFCNILLSNDFVRLRALIFLETIRILSKWPISSHQSPRQPYPSDRRSARNPYHSAAGSRSNIMRFDQWSLTHLLACGKWSASTVPVNGAIMIHYVSWCISMSWLDLDSKECFLSDFRERSDLINYCLSVSR